MIILSITSAEYFTPPLFCASPPRCTSHFCNGSVAVKRGRNMSVVTLSTRGRPEGAGGGKVSAQRYFSGLSPTLQSLYCVWCLYLVSQLLM